MLSWVTVFAIFVDMKNAVRNSFLVLSSVWAIISCTTPRLTNEDYIGFMDVEGRKLKFVLTGVDHQPKLSLVSFRGYELPIADFTFDNDTVRFRRTDAPSYYSGYHDENTKNIIGSWKGEDNITRPLTFLPTNTDTIKGFNPRTTNIYEYSLPPAKDDNLKVGSLNDAGIDQQLTDSLVHQIMEMKFGYVHSVLIARKNRLAWEEYFFEYKREAHFGIQSVTKSFVSALMGIAIDKNEIREMDAPLHRYLPGYKTLLTNEQNNNITLHDMMNMSSGLRWDEVTYEYGHEQNSSMIASESGDAIGYLLSQPRSPEKEFAYNSLNHTLVSNVLHEATGLSNSEEYKKRLLEPLGITAYDLGEEKNGIVGDIFLRPRDMLKFGLMYLNHGEWNGQQIVPSSWIKRSTTPMISIEPGLGYGYFWWTKTFPWKNKTVHSYFAWGYGGQYIFVIPELELVVVFNGTNWNTDPRPLYFDMMEDFIVKACL